MTKLMVCSLLAMAVTASTALANGGEGDKKNGNGNDKKDEGLYQGGGGWSFKPGEGITYAGGDTFNLTIVNQLQVKWMFTNLENGPDTNTFSVRRARMMLDGNVFDKNVVFRLWLEATDTGAFGSVLKDGWIQWSLSSSNEGTIAVRAGQSKTGFGLESTGFSGGLDFVERSLATRTFADVRSQGAWIYGVHAENRLRWNAGVQNGDVSAGALGVTDVGEETPNSDNVPTFEGNVSFDPMGDFFGGKLHKEGWRQGDLEGTPELKGTIGGGIMLGNGRTAAVGGTDIDSTNININTAWKVKQICLMGEVFIRSDNPSVGPTEDTTGWYVSGTYVMPKSGNTDLQWGFGGRVSHVNADSTAVAAGIPAGTPVPDITEITLGVNAFYHGHACKTQFNYTWQHADFNGGVSDQDNNILEVMVTLLF